MDRASKLALVLLNYRKAIIKVKLHNALWAAVKRTNTVNAKEALTSFATELDKTLRDSNDDEDARLLNELINTIDTGPDEDLNIGWITDVVEDSLGIELGKADMDEEREALKKRLESGLAAASKNLADKLPSLSAKNEKERKYSWAYQNLVKAGFRPQIRGKYRGD